MSEKNETKIMPTRRHLIALTATTASAGLYGCVSPPEETDDDDEEEEDDDTEPVETDDTEEEDDDEDEEELEPEFRFGGFSAPDEVNLNEEFQVEFTVENVGEAEGTYETEIRHHFEWTGYTFEDISLEVPAGESATYSSEEFSMPYLGWFELEVPDFNERVRTNSMRPRLSFEDSFRTPRGLEIEVLEGDTTSRYRYRRSDGTLGNRSAPGTNTRWGRVMIRCSNTTDRSLEPPALSEFDMPQAVADVVDDEQMVDGYSDDRRIAEDGVREGWLVFEVPDDVTRGDLSLIWEREFDEGESRARWDR